jgi:starvation-inducible DNA-binding protein
MEGIYMGLNRDYSLKPRPRVFIQPNIGLDSDARHTVVEILNNTLANEAVLTLKTRSALWNIRRAGFFDRHTLFDVQYKQLGDLYDEISKRILELGGLPISSFGEFLKKTQLDEQPGGVPEIMDLLTDHEAIIRFLREDAKKCSEEHEDEVTRDFLVHLLCLHEKMAWMLRAYIEPQMSPDERRASQAQAALR